MYKHKSGEDFFFRYHTVVDKTLFCSMPLFIRFNSIPKGSVPIFDFFVLLSFLSPLFKCMDLKQVIRFSTSHNEVAKDVDTDLGRTQNWIHTKIA